MRFIGVPLLLTFVSYGMAFQFNLSLPDTAKAEIDACISRSEKTPVFHWQAELACLHDFFANLKPNNLTEEDLAVFQRTVDKGFGHHPPTTGISTRREVRTLSEEEWRNVTDVFRKLYDAGTLQSFGRLHGLAIWRAHKGAAFLPWHRVFLAHFEQEMRSINPSVSLPYWDYTIDYEIPQPYESVLWTPCYFGEDNDVVKSGAFSFFYGAHGAFISRKVARKFYSTRLINKADIGILKGFCDFKDITTGTDETPRDNNLESLHDSVHDYVGGDMGVVQNSAYDPIFWFHHAFIDYIWEAFREHQIQECSTIDVESNYRPLDDIGWKIVSKVGPEDSMFGYNHLKNIDGLWRNWTEVFYSYEPQPECGSTCSGKYLYCDDKNRCLTRTKEFCTEEKHIRVSREAVYVDPLEPKLPCGTGTTHKGLKGDGRTRNTSKAECQKILTKERNGEMDPKHEDADAGDDAGMNCFFVLLGIAIGVACTCLVKYCKKKYCQRKY